ncbi:MAG: hypothetical protein DRO15_06375, partial [Thermoprotei archaeon]
KNRNYCVTRNRFLILEHRRLVLSRKLSENFLFNMIKNYIRKWQIVVIVNHYWLFLLSTELLAVWYRLLDLLLSDERISVISISDAYERLICSK